MVLKPVLFQVNSPAKDQIPPDNFYNGAPLLDQRGYQRVGDYDIGAYEFAGVPIEYAISGNAGIAGAILSGQTERLKLQLQIALEIIRS